MRNHYIYSYSYIVEKSKQKKTVTVIYIDKDEIDQPDLKREITLFYEANQQTDKVVILAPEFAEDCVKDVFLEKMNDTFFGIPKKEDVHLKENLYIYLYDKQGKSTLFHGEKIHDEFHKTYLNEGLQNIFIGRGGLISSQGSHHFVFPSGKHCDKFLRTGNILINSSEIFFIAYGLLKFFNEESHEQIFCDTSSINSVAFALIELKNRFLTTKKVKVSIKSFSSYKGLYKNDFDYDQRDLLLVSASTSANILAYILMEHKHIERENIVIMYFLDMKGKGKAIEDRLLCDLTYHEEINTNGLKPYKTFTDQDCEFCKQGSYPVTISGDVFNLDKPKINRILFGKKDAHKKLSSFIDRYRTVDNSEPVLKVNYKENTNSKEAYEVFIDYKKIHSQINDRFKAYKTKLDKKIGQHVPNNLKYIVHLNDEGSKDLANYINDKVSEYITPEKRPILCSQDEMIEKVKRNGEEEGAILIVGSCISNGKNLLYISRALRPHDYLRITYFVGIVRTKDKPHLDSLKVNLTLGEFGRDTFTFVSVETIFCNNDYRNTSWLREQSFLKEFREFFEDEFPDETIMYTFLSNRLNLLRNSASNQKIGLTNKLFYPHFKKEAEEELEIRKNFAFFEFSDYVQKVSQSDLYFTVSNFVNSTRCSSLDSRTLKQTVYVRNLIDPANFNRFNDGIIQASILRSATAEELAYDLDEELSKEISDILETMIKYCNSDQGEALLEFLYAIAIEKLSIKENYLKKVLDSVDSNCSNSLMKGFGRYIQKNIIDEKKKDLDEYLSTN